MTNTPGEDPPQQEQAHQQPVPPSGQGAYPPGSWEPYAGYPHDPGPPGYAPVPPQHPAYPPPDHPQAVTSLVVGIVGLVLCGGLISPVAWYLGGKAVKEIDASRGQVGGRGAAQAGHVTGIIGTCYLALWVLAMVVFVGLFGLAVLGAAHSGSGADFHMG